ncbi:MAG: hypothetical protein L6R40_007717 [Gallowayella cf. fulva]|nr:MAG: hypothetical protein L6R40_007717 [Xanthomendoza cf. fulva]
MASTASLPRIRKHENDPKAEFTDPSSPLEMIVGTVTEVIVIRTETSGDDRDLLIEAQGHLAVTPK